MPGEGLIEHLESGEMPSQQVLDKLLEDGLQAFQEGDYGTCVNCWENLTQFDNTNYRILVYLSLAYNRMGAPELARGALIRATKIEPRYAKAWNNLGNSFRETGELFRAVDAYEKAVKLKGTSADYRYNLAITYLDTLNYDQAIDQFRAYRQLDADDDSILLLLASAYYQIGRAQKGFNCLRVYLQKHPDTSQFARIRAQMKLLRGVIETQQAKAEARAQRESGIDSGTDSGTDSGIDDSDDDLVEAAMVEALSDEELVAVEAEDSGAHSKIIEEEPARTRDLSATSAALREDAEEAQRLVGEEPDRSPAPASPSGSGAAAKRGARTKDKGAEGVGDGLIEWLDEVLEDDLDDASLKSPSDGALPTVSSS